MTALLHALANLARLRWLGAAFCALAMLCVTTHASAHAGATAHARIDVNASVEITSIASASQLAQTKDRVRGFDQNSQLHVWILRSASAETYRGFSPTLPETASGPSYAARGGWQRFLPEAAKRVDAAKLKYGGEGVLNMAKKADIKQIDRLVREVGLSPGQREILHEEMRALKGADGLGSFDELLELANEIKGSFPGK